MLHIGSECSDLYGSFQIQFPGMLRPPRKLSFKNIGRGAATLPFDWMRTRHDAGHPSRALDLTAVWNRISALPLEIGVKRLNSVYETEERYGEMESHVVNIGFSNQSFPVLGLFPPIELLCSSLGCVRVWCTFCGTSGTKGATTMVPCLHFRQMPAEI